MINVNPMIHSRRSNLAKTREKRNAKDTVRETCDSPEKLEEQSKPEPKQEEDEIFQNLRKMVDNLIMDSIPSEQNTKDSSKVSSSLLNAAKGKGTQSRRSLGRSRSRGFTEIFGIYSPPPPVQKQPDPHLKDDPKNVAAARTVLSLFNVRPKPIIVTLPTTQRRLARMANMNIKWPSLANEHNEK